MLTEVLLSGVVKLVSAVLTAVLPTDPPPDMSAAAVVVPMWSFFDTWLPLTEAVELAVLSVQVLGVLAVGWMVLWVIRRIPLISGA